jgi:hypothetical protein
MNHRQGKTYRDCGIEGIASLPKYFDSNLGGKRVGRCDRATIETATDVDTITAKPAQTERQEETRR